MTTKPPTPSLVTSFLACNSQADIAAVLGSTAARLKFHLYAAKAPQYREFFIPKAGGGQRTIAAPPVALHGWQTSLATILTHIYVPKKVAQGFIPSRSIATNARHHLARCLILNIDLADFFPSIHFGRVRGIFLKPPFLFSQEVASTLAQLCTNNGRLPQGAPTSPMLSNFVCRRMDTDLDRFARKYSCRVTRYVDDITFSTNSVRFPLALVAALDPYGASVTLGDELLQLFLKHDFVIQPGKSRVRTRQQRQEVTGLIVNNRLNVPRTYVRRLRAIINSVRRLGFPDAEARYRTLDSTRIHRLAQPPSLHEHLRGKLEYLRMIRGDGDAIYVKYALCARQLRIRVFPVRITGVAAQYVDLIEEALLVVLGFDNVGAQVAQGTAFYLEHVGVVTASHVIANPSVPVMDWRLQRMRPPYLAAAIVGYTADAHLDLAILKTDAAASGALRATAIEPASGDEVRLVGYPNWHSTADRSLNAECTIVQTKVISGLHYSSVGYSLLSGISGAPVLNGDGNVVGTVVNSPRNSTLPNAFLSIAHIPHAAAGKYHSL